MPVRFSDVPSRAVFLQVVPLAEPSLCTEVGQQKSLLLVFTDLLNIGGDMLPKHVKRGREDGMPRATDSRCG